MVHVKKDKSVIDNKDKSTQQKQKKRHVSRIKAVCLLSENGLSSNQRASLYLAPWKDGRQLSNNNDNRTAVTSHIKSKMAAVCLHCKDEFIS